MKEIFTRRSIREYDLTKKLTREELIDIVKAGMSSPTARNQQAWRFMIIDDENIIKDLKINKSTLDTTKVNTYILVLGNKEAPIQGLHDTDLAIAQANMMTYARHKDLGTCWVGIHGNPEREEFLTKLLNIPSNLYPYSLMAIGYPKSLDMFKEVDRFDESKIYYNGF